MARILIIDDEEQVRDLLQGICQAEGYETVVAPNGKEGVEKNRSQPADVIITDLIMPDKEGIETIIELKRDFPESKIIAISGGGSLSPKNYLVIATRMGAAYTFTKPLDLITLLSAIKNLLT